MHEQPPDVMTFEEVMAYLRIPRSSLYKLAQERKIPAQKVGRHWRFRREALDRWLEGISVKQLGEDRGYAGRAAR
jgi:excisionase family DNA binding protein